MSGSNRGSLIAKLNKVLKQHFKPIFPSGSRPLLEQLLFACCLENAPYDTAEKTYEHLSASFFDWNEVRVSTVRELAEAMRDLPDPSTAASNLKCVLQTVFEAAYSFDLEAVKKQNLGVAIKRLAKMEGATPFVVAYATQYALEGHSIPLDRGALEVLYIVGIATEAERQSGAVAGLERAIPKSKGTEFGSLLHQLAADLVANPFSPAVKTLLLAINPDAKERLPKRGQKRNILEKPAEPVAAKSPPAKADAKGAQEKPGANKTARDAAHQPGKQTSAKKDVNDGKKPASLKPVETPATKKPLSRKVPSAKPIAKVGAPSGHKSSTKQLVKRKPR